MTICLHVALLLLTSQEPVAPSSRAEEARLAASAAPESLRAGVGLYLLGPEGFERERESDNGLTCLVERGPEGSVEPVCWDEEGAKTILPVVLEKAKLRAERVAEEDIRARVAEGFSTGRFRAPRRSGVAYMLSRDNFVWNGERIVKYHPHIMVYAPYVTNGDIGSDGSDPRMPWVLNEGSPHAYIITVVGPEE